MKSRDPEIKPVTLEDQVVATILIAGPQGPWLFAIDVRQLGFDNLADFWSTSGSAIILQTAAGRMLSSKPGEESV